MDENPDIDGYSADIHVWLDKNPQSFQQCNPCQAGYKSSFLIVNPIQIFYSVVWSSSRYLISIKQLNDLFITWSWLIHYFFLTCSQLVHDFFTTWSQFVHDFLITCLQRIYELSMTCSKLFKTCSWPVHNLFRTIYDFITFL